ncbi:MAG: hypothetical protein HQM00_08765 [Magnetococcales bacterium]|nr:hypothetical protein [Magnetococcales bacterium]
MNPRPDDTPTPTSRASAPGFQRVAAIFLTLTGAVLLAWGGRLHEHPLLPVSVATVHLYVLGVLTMALIGIALKQLPRWTAVPLPWPGLNPWTLGFLALGALTVFLGIGTDLHPWTLLVASLGVGVALSFFLLQAGIMLIKSPRRDPLTALLAIAILSLSGVFVLGGIFLGEYSHGFLPYDRFAMVGTHLTWGLFGWAGILLGVTRLAGPRPDSPAFRPSLSWPLVAGALGSLVLVPLTLFTPQLDPRWLWAAMLPGSIALAALTLAGRKQNPGNRYGHAGDLLGLLALTTLLLWPLRPEPEWRLLFGVLILPGWSLSQLFGLHEGLRLTGPGRFHLPIHLLAVGLPALGLFLPWELVWRAGGVLMILSGALFFGVERLGESS